jgi:hypothetical protein
MQRKLLVLCISVLIISANVFAADAPPAPTPAKPEASTTGLKSKNESWYTLWGAGYAGTSYTGDLKTVVDSLNSSSSLTHASLGMDILGFYWPINNHQTMIGGVMNAAVDSWTVTGAELSLNQYQMSFSAQHFFGANIGDGIFVRGDIGPTYLNVTATGSGLNLSADSKAGFGALAGVGYALPVWEETRVLFNLNYAFRRVEGSRMGAFGLSVGFLF